ncbi:MAG: allophanate hydrolase subunit 2 family protein [Marmoricola sp.]|nr:allophanate hydrolase subunit 2 family protein [Marmoricola sp.]
MTDHRPGTGPSAGAHDHGPPRITVESAGFAVVQDLGRPGHGDKGIAVNGAGDRWSAQMANVLVGNAPGTPLLETVGSSTSLHFNADTLVSITGASTRPLVAGRPAPMWDPFVVEAGATLVLPTPDQGWRLYVAVAGGLQETMLLGSVSPDPLLGVGRRLSRGDTLDLGSCVCGVSHPHYVHPLFRLGARRPSWRSTAVVEVTPGPELHQFDEQALRGPWEVSPQSDQVGLRAEGATPARTTVTEILSRGVPVGAVEVPPVGGLLVLLYGRLLTAGYPVPYVATTVSLDTLGQVRPGDHLVLRRTNVPSAVEQLLAGRRELAEVAARATTALSGSGLLQERAD